LELVVGVDVNGKRVVGSGDSGGGGVRDGERVCLDVEARGFKALEDVAKGAFLYHYHHHGFDQTFNTQHSICNSIMKREIGIEKSEQTIKD